MKHINLLLLSLSLFLFQQCDSQPVVTPDEKEPIENNDPEQPYEPGDTDEPEDPSETGTWASASEINARLGRGINIGNTYEAE